MNFMPFSTLKKSLAEATVIAVLVSLGAILANFVHPHRIPLFSPGEYETMVPCPAQEGHVHAIPAANLDPNAKHTMIIDARDKQAYNQWHYPGAISLTYDFLDPIATSDLNRIARSITAKRISKVIVYGDGTKLDTGKLLGVDISAAGIKNVFFVKGGASALQQADSAQSGRQP